MARVVLVAVLPWVGERVPMNEALADQGDWTAALKACEGAARMVRQSHWRGELLDGAALAAQELGRPDLSKRLEAARRGTARSRSSQTAWRANIPR
jgi:hypothetical protein